MRSNPILVISSVTFFICFAFTGSAKDTYRKAWNVTACLHRSLIGNSDFSKCQQACNLPVRKIPQDVRTRWASSCAMGANLVNNLQAVQEFDPQHKNPGDAWGDNKLNTQDWD